MRGRLLDAGIILQTSIMKPCLTFDGQRLIFSPASLASRCSTAMLSLHSLMQKQLPTWKRFATCYKPPKFVWSQQNEQVELQPRHEVWGITGRSPACKQSFECDVMTIQILSDKSITSCCPMALLQSARTWTWT